VNCEDYHTTITFKLSLGDVKNADVRYDEAQKLLRECLAKINDDKKSATCLSKLSVSYMEAFQYDEAGKLLVECLEISRRIDGENYPLTIGILLNLATVYEFQNKLDKVEAIRKECLT
jgi:tetratricopeptide (TPR) repeat protein